MSTSKSATTAALSSVLLFGLAPLGSAQRSECHKLLPNDGLAGDLFGSAVATDGSLIAVGAPNADDLGSDSGSAYLFGAQSGGQHLELHPSDGAANDRFGASIAVDGAHLVVGAPLADGAGGQDSGAAYVFDAATGLQVFKLEPADGAAGDQFGYAVAVDGGLVVVGGLGAAYLFDASTGQELAKLLPVGGSVGGFGEAVDIDAGLVVVGARLANGVSGFSGAAFIFDAASGNELHKLIAVDGTVWAFFGACVGIEGSVVAIGAPEAGPKGKHSGAAYQFDAITGQQTRKLVPSDGHVFAKFGSSVDTSGPHVVVGSEQNNASGFSSGSVYVYDVQSGSLVVKLIASDAAPLDELGSAVAYDGEILVSGAARDDDLGDASGSAYVFNAAGCGGLGDSYCDSNPNSSGSTAALTASGSAEIAQNDITFDAESLPVSQFGYFLMSATKGFVPFFGGSQGNLCLGGQIIRFDQFVLSSGGMGAVTFSPDLLNLPQGIVLSPGETWNFQYWTRDLNPMQTSNTSNGIEIQFQ